MNTHASISPYGTMTAPTTLTIQRLLNGPVERVWSCLVDSEMRRKWLAAGPLEARAGGAFTFIWRNDDLSRPPIQRPEGMGEEMTMHGQVLAVEAPRRLEITWGDQGGSVLFELEARGDRVLLTIVHRRLDERAMRTMVGAGWHMHLDILAAELAGRTPPSFWDGWSALRAEYDRSLPA